MPTSNFKKKDILTNVLRLRKVLAAREIKSTNMFIREIVLTHDIASAQGKKSYLVHGEFDDLGSDVIPRTRKRKDQETDAELIARIFDEIVDIAQLARKNDSQRIISRITTEEFFFYPQKQRGPISQYYFMQLIAKLEEFASTLQPNIHLALSTFPVLDDRGQVHNQMLYVQSGPNPRIDLFSKASPHVDDPEYSQTSSPYFAGGSPVKQMEKRLRELALILLEEFFTSPTSKNVSKIIEQINNNISIDYRADAKDLISVLDEFKRNPLLIDLDDRFEQTFEKFLILIASKSKKFEENNNTQISENKIGMTNRRYGGYIASEGFNVVAEICADFYLKPGSKALERDIESVNNIIPDKVSQLVSSNSISIVDEESFLSSDQRITQADPLKFAINKFKDKTEGVLADYKMADFLEDKKSRGFGRDILVCCYKPIKISEFKTALRERIEEHNSFVLDLRALELYKSSHPAEIDLVNEMIHERIMRGAFQRVTLSVAAIGMFHHPLAQPEVKQEQEEIVKNKLKLN